MTLFFLLARKYTWNKKSVRMDTIRLPIFGTLIKAKAPAMYQHPGARHKEQQSFMQTEYYPNIPGRPARFDVSRDFCGVHRA